MLDNVFSVSLFLLGLAFTFFIPGFCVLETFFPKLPSRIKVPLYFILSLMVSTYVVYFVGLLIGFSRASILICFLLFTPWFIFCLWKHWRDLKVVVRECRWQILSGAAVYLIFFLALSPGIFTPFAGNIVMSSVNWQDTAMHLEIIQSLSQGNFPPQAPYYAGVPLTYYYFTDFHSAILTALFGGFFPRVLVYDNPFFAGIFTMSVYAVAYELTRKRSFLAISSFSATLFGSLIFVRFFADVGVAAGGTPLLKRIVELLSSRTYSMEYEQLFQMANMADYFLQNRPMMVGLPAAVIVLTLVLYAFRKKELKIVLLVGIIVGLLIKFQLFAVLVGLITFGAGLLFFFKTKDAVFFLKSLAIYLLLILIFFLLFGGQLKMGGNSLLGTVRENFSLGSWERGVGWGWHLKFIGANFGLPFVATLLTALWLIGRAMRKKQMPKSVVFLTSLALVFLAIPYTLRFTIYKGDMFKFFYFAVPLMSLVSVWVIGTVIKRKSVQTIVFLLLFVGTTFSSLLTLVNSALNKNFAYSAAELEAGLWIRANTPPRSVFLAWPTVHSPVSQVGGRLRVLSYINWPYSHGYNQGEDNVFRRLDDVQSVYEKKSGQKIIETAIKYKVDYIYYGAEEKEKAPDAGEFFDSLPFLNKVYSSGEIDIYEI